MRKTLLVFILFHLRPRDINVFMSKKKEKQPLRVMHLALEGNFIRHPKNRKPKLSAEQRKIKSDAWRELEYRKPKLEDM